MFLYLVRHGESMSREEDPERPLSGRGRDDVERVAAFIAGVKVEQIFHSGKLRARETARILGDRLGAVIEENHGMDPMDDPDIWVKRLRSMEADTMLVGHLPHMGRLASLLLFGESEAEVIKFRMGCVVCLKREEGRCSLQWMVLPEMTGQEGSAALPGGTL